MEGLQKNLEGIREAIEEHERDIGENTRERDSLQEAMSRLDDLIDAARAEESQAGEDLRLARNEAQGVEQRIRILAERQGRIESDLKENGDRITALEGLADSDAENTRKARETVREAEEKAGAEQALLEEAIAEADEAEKELDDHKNKILAAVNRLSDVRNQEARAQAVHAQMTVRLEELLGGRDDQREKEKQLSLKLAEAEKASAAAEELLRAKTAEAEKKRRAVEIGRAHV